MSDATRMAPGRATGCPPEWTLSVYVDRELEPHEMRVLGAHLVGCRSCRELVVALEEEADALRAALRLEEPRQARVVEARAGRGLALSIAAAVAGAFAGLALLRALLGLEAPAALAWLDPIEWSTVPALVLDALFLLRDEAPALFQLVVSVAALGSVAFVLTASFSLLTRRLLDTRSIALALAAAALPLLTAPQARAFELLASDEEAVVREGEVVEATWVGTARTVSIEGTLRGDLVAAGDRVSVSGVLDGNLIAAAHTIEISGRVTGSVLVAGERLHLRGQIERNAYAAAELVTLAEAGSVGGDFAGAGEGVVISGSVGRDALAFAEWTELRGRVGRHLRVHSERSDVLREASVGGDLHVAWSGDEEAVSIDPVASVAGETTIERAEHRHDDPLARYTGRSFYAWLAISFAAAYLTGMVAFRLAPWLFAARVHTGREFFRALGLGLATLVAVPIGGVLLALTVIGIPLAAIVLFAFATSLYLAQVVAGSIAGAWLVGEPESSDWRSFGLPLLTGLAVVWLLTSLPWLGGVVLFVTLLAGLGLLADLLWTRLRA